MPTVVSPENAGNYTQDEIADLERQAGGMSTAIHTVDPPTRSTAADRAAFDADLVDKTVDVIGQQFERMSQAAIQAYAKSLVDTMAGKGEPTDPAYIAKRAAAQAEVEAGLRASGVTLEARPDPRVEALSRAVGVPVEPKAFDYAPDFNRFDLPPERLQNLKAVSGQFAADLRLDPIVGRSVIEHIAETFQRYGKMTPNEREIWKSREGSALLKSAGSRAEVERIINSARKVMGMSGEITGPLGKERFSETLVNSAVFSSAWLLRTLDAHATALATFEAARGRL
jgi:hypothetical protein